MPSAVTGADTVTKAPDGSKHALYAGSGYGSNMIYLGSTISRNQPYGYGSLIYGFNGELYASVSVVHLSGLNPFLSFYIGALSYNHTFNSWFDISAGAYRYEVAQSLADSLFGSLHTENSPLVLTGASSIQKFRPEDCCRMITRPIFS